MSGNRPSRWYFPWVPLGLAGVVAACVAGWLLFGTGQPQAHAATLTPEATAGFQTTDKLVLTINLPATKTARAKDTLRVELLDAEGNSVADAEQEVPAGNAASNHRFEFKTPKQTADKLSVRCQFGKEEVKVPLQKILLVKAHETALTAGTEFYAGSVAAIRCEVHGVKSFTETIPLPGAAVTITLTPKDAKEPKAVTLYEGKVGADGVAAIPVKLPAVPAGNYKMEVTTRSDLGEEKLEREVKVKDAPKVLLVTDKPLYQPGQLMHLRALALKAFDLAPAAKSTLVFEVEDPKGNKVFKREVQTSDYGVAAIDFQLADEVNQGDYRIRAILGEHTADKTVTVKPYVLPKFKAEVKADKTFYMPKETVNVDLQVDYFFGKPVAGGKVKVSASTFDVAFKEFSTWEGKTDERGHVKFDVKLPDYFVGQPLQKGDALVKLEVKVTDTADHTETINKTYPVSDQPIKVSLIPEGGRLVPGMDNRVFAAAITPDGKPAQCEVSLWVGQKADGKALATLKTNEAGLAEFRLTPKAEQFRQGEWAQRNIEMLGGQKQTINAPKILFDLYAVAKDGKGAEAKTLASLNGEPVGDNVVLRLDKAVYKGGDSLNLDIRTSAGLPTVYCDVIKNGQTLLTKWMDVKDGKAAHKLDLPAGAFGTLDVHAYQMLASGEIIRDSRVVYVNPASDLKIDVKADKDEYRPGNEGMITFKVTDKDGKPTAAALGVVIVDEAVYALQDMQPGLEKVYFTLQEELLKPQAQAVFKPSEGLDVLVRHPELDDARQQVAEVLLTAVKAPPPAKWDVNPTFERRQKLEGQLRQIGWALYNYASSRPFLAKDENTGKWGFLPGLLDKLVKEQHLDKALLTDPVGGRLTLESLARLDKEFSADRLARAVTQQRMQTVYWSVVNIANNNLAKWFKDNKWTYPATVVEDGLKLQGYNKEQIDLFGKDPWGAALKVEPVEKKRENPWGQTQFHFHELVSAGPDGKVGTADDVKFDVSHQGRPNVWWNAQDERTVLLGLDKDGGNWARRDRLMDMAKEQKAGEGRFGGPFPGGAPGLGGGGFGGPGGALPPMVAPAPTTAAPRPDTKEDGKATGGGAPIAEGGGGGAPPPRLREYFPETMLWRPSLITDDRGVARMPLTFADSITTWRLTASASSRGGQLGGVTASLRVFQDFFVDLDLPLNLTRNDEVAFPVAVFNYLKTPQTVTIELKDEPWFELLDSQGRVRKLELKPNEVTSVKYRIRARQIGSFPLEVLATGSKLSDNIRRQIDVVPDGKKVEQVFSDKLSGKTTQSIVIPDFALPDASKLLVKVYPGVFSQVLEGTEGMLRLPGG